jgi:EAL and modified HD-GYP domain-containing signal transduction protein
MEYFVSRNPIFKRDQNILGYYLTFQHDVENALFEISYLVDKAKKKQALNFTEITSGKPSFIHFSVDSIEGLVPNVLDNESTVIIHNANKMPTQELLIALLNLHDMDFKLCLHNINNELDWESIYPIINYISFDINILTADELFRIVDCIGKFPNLKLIATQVNDITSHNKAIEMGFDYLQGNFFSHTEILMSHAMSPAETTLAELLYQTSQANVNLVKIVEIIKRDVYLTYKILGYANTVFFKRRKQISTIKQAVVTLGLVELKRFISILFTTQLSKNRSKELVRFSLYRGKFCELITKLKCQNKIKLEEDCAEAFLVGLLSLIEPMFNESAENALQKLSLSADITNAILNNQGELAQYLALAKISEQGDWQTALENAQLLNLDKKTLIKINSTALLWANEQMQILNIDS